MSGFLARHLGRVERAIPAVHKRKLSQRSWSQEGEDMILARHFGEKATGFYVDVGAHHPFRFSNTQLFYERGWSGINIDAMPGSMKAFRRYRRRDINLEIGIGAEPGISQFFVFNEGALNTFDEATARTRDRPPFKIERVIEVCSRPLRDILQEHAPHEQSIDFLTIDVEGRDLEVLGSNDWKKFRPRVVLAESYGRGQLIPTGEPIQDYLDGVGYDLFAKTVNTFIFIDKSG